MSKSRRKSDGQSNHDGGINKLPKKLLEDVDADDVFSDDGEQERDRDE